MNVLGLSFYYHRSPERISDREVQAYLLHLMRERKLSWSSCNVAVHGLRFFYHQTLGWEKTTFHIPGPRKPSRLPEILSRQEVARLLANTRLPRHRVLLMTAPQREGSSPNRCSSFPVLCTVLPCSTGAMSTTRS